MDTLEKRWTVTEIIAAGFVPQGKGAPVHTNRSSHGFVYNVAYTTDYTFDHGYVLHCEPGCFGYLPKGSNYTVQPVETGSGKNPRSGTYFINFQTLSETETGKPFGMQIHRQEKILALYTRAETVWRGKHVGYGEQCMGCLYELLAFLKQEQARRLPVSQLQLLLKPAVQYMEKSYSEESVPVPELAKLCGISEQYFRRIFKEVYQTSPSVYMRAQRLRYARELLDSGEYSVTAAAMQAGFNDPAYFSREFHKAYGVSAREYQNASRK